MRKVCLARVIFCPEHVKNECEKIEALGYNSGNVVWYEAVKRSIHYDEEIPCFQAEKYKSMDDKKLYIVPMANNIDMYSIFLERIESCLINESDRLVVLGLGSQLTEEFNTPRKLMAALPQERITALKRISERCVTMGIRGEITAECLDLIGIHNYKVIGCPSFYSNSKVIQEICAKKWNNYENLSFNLSGYGKQGIAHFVSLLFSSKYINSYRMVLQDMSDMPRTIFEDMPVLDRHMETKFPQTNVSGETYTRFLKNNGRIFFDFTDWIKYFEQEKIDISIGTRFHGNMIALLAGVPALWIAHDSRTLELCKAMGLPYINVEDMEKYKYIEDMYGYFEKYNQEFLVGYQKRYEEYQNFLSENGIRYKMK